MLPRPREPRLLPRRPLTRALLALLALIAALLASPGCGVAYVVRSGYFQAELLAHRVPVEKVRQTPDLTEEQRRALDTIADVKAFGEQVGLKPTRNYDTVAQGWTREIWNVSAAPPTSFDPETWWFPIVGRVPYLGYFRKEDADRTVADLRAKGLDAYARTAGAYSTLGWFRDPILPAMLTWDEFDLADTVMHELAHATVWVPGSVSFNESFASFVGEEGAFRYIEARHGKDSPELQKARADFEDYLTWRALQQSLYEDLNRVYEDTTRSEADKLAEKAALFAALPERVGRFPFHTPDRYLRAATQGTWNNARLVQFRTYNHNRAAFETLLARHNGDLLAFMEDVRRITADVDDPYDAVERAAQGP